MNTLSSSPPRSTFIDGIIAPPVLTRRTQELNSTDLAGRLFSRSTASPANRATQVMDIIPAERLSIARSTQLAHRNRPVALQQRPITYTSGGLRKAASGIVTPIALACAAIAAVIKRRKAATKRKMENMSLTISEALADKRQKIAALFAGLGSRLGLGLSRIKWAPKKYTAAHGRQNDYSGKTFTNAKLALPVIVVLLVFSLFVAAWTPAGKNFVAHATHSSSTSNTSRNAASAPGKSAAVNGKNGGKNSNAGQPSSESKTGAPGAPTGTPGASGGTTSPASGGRGSGSPAGSGSTVATTTGTVASGSHQVVTTVPVTLPVPDSSTSNQLPATVSIPAQSVQSGGKQIIGTNEIKLTLN